MAKVIACTPGPWKASKAQIYGFDILTQGDVEREGSAEVASGAIGMGAIANPADARLMAAAPELLEALQRIVGCWKSGWDIASDSPIGDKVRAALTKATGAANG